jgi:hypothetical protein
MAINERVMKKGLLKIIISSCLTSTLYLLQCMNLQTQAQRRPLTIPERSCLNLGIPINKSRITSRASATNRRTLNDNKGSFERAAIRSVRVTLNRSQDFPSEQRRSRYRVARVEPDGITSAMLTVIDRRGITGVRVYINSVFFDAKFRMTRIGFTTDDGQALGYLDYLGNSSSAGRAARRITNPLLRPTPGLVYLTPSDAVIGTSITGDNRTATYGVAVFQHVACDRTGQGGRIGVDDLVMGRGIILNPTVFNNRFPPPNLDLPAGRPFTLSDPPRNPPTPY